MFRSLTFLAWLVTRVVRALFLTRSELLIENLALRQQVLALKRERPRPVLDDVDRAFWVALRASWPGWVSRLVIVDPDTVTKWYTENGSGATGRRSRATAVPGDRGLMGYPAAARVVPVRRRAGLPHLRPRHDLR